MRAAFSTRSSGPALSDCQAQRLPHGVHERLAGSAGHEPDGRRPDQRHPLARAIARSSTNQKTGLLRGVEPGVQRLAGTRC